MSRHLLFSLAVVWLAVTVAQTSRAQNASSTPATAQTSSAPETEPKKVWTNEDVSDLRANSTISTVGHSTGSQARQPHASRPKDAKWYHDQIEKLEKQLPAINARIAQLQAGIDGKFTGDAKESTRPAYGKFGDWKTELEQLEKQRDDIEARDSALRDEARHAGVPPNALP